MLNNDTSMRFPENCEFELGFWEIFRLWIDKGKRMKDIPRRRMKCAKFLMRNGKGQNELGQGSGKEKTKRKYEVTIGALRI